jgi:hypothetical protein
MCRRSAVKTLEFLRVGITIKNLVFTFQKFGGRDVCVAKIDPETLRNARMNGPGVVVFLNYKQASKIRGDKDYVSPDEIIITRHSESGRSIHCEISAY